MKTWMFCSTFFSATPPAVLHLEIVEARGIIRDEVCGRWGLSIRLMDIYISQSPSAASNAHRPESKSQSRSYGSQAGESQWMHVYKWSCGVWTDGWAYRLDVWALSVCECLCMFLMGTSVRRVPLFCLYGPFKCVCACVFILMQFSVCETADRFKFKAWQWVCGRRDEGQVACQSRQLPFTLKSQKSLLTWSIYTEKNASISWIAVAS